MTRRLIAILATAAALAAAAFAPSAASAWAPADQATVHPGVQTVTEGAQCTSNFIFQDASGTYLGQAAHCSGTGAATDTDGCDSGSLPIGTPVEIDGASRPGTLVYNSWLTMQAKHETDEETCAYNDLALVKIDPADVGNVNPSVPGFGGPTGLAGGPTLATLVHEQIVGLSRWRPRVVATGVASFWAPLPSPRLPRSSSVDVRVAATKRSTRPRRRC